MTLDTTRSIISHITPSIFFLGDKLIEFNISQLAKCFLHLFVFLFNGQFMKRRAVFIYLVLLIPFTLLAQRPFGNEWINPSQEYLAIKVAEDGIYRVSYDELSAATQTNLSSVNPDNFQLFYRGKEQYIHVQLKGSAFQSGDYIEFFGKKNRGEIDRPLFREPEDQVNTTHAIFSDTSVYLLTWGTQAGLRYRHNTRTISNSFE